MKDLNFFEPYIEKKEFKIDKELIFYGTMVLIVLCMIFYGIINQIKIVKLNREVAKLKLEAEDESVQKRIEELKFQEEEIADIKGKVEQLKTVDEYIEDRDIINEYLLQSINSRTPEEVFLKSMSIDTASMQIEGISKDKYSIAEFEHSLKNNIDFEESFISNISFEDGYYNFSLNIKLKDEDEYDNGDENRVQEDENETEENESIEE
ncbi:PilN domain-containing protein [Sporanaerobacter acetigenes]|uniref:Fimbrial assembly protein (PilN) n=1 Tax=Sporanaerobacter acetigenes DSM 13106 TaxID=1123281 RepID=A0A1M5TWG0_9FIRM|nr:PilN domain-containing protein [Sporanaerobacter acetigenes]SHH54991.1 Fimbrial assembly protein (PilN) [Sporanaerobacter acetigenes DSM 13106]